VGLHVREGGKERLAELGGVLEVAVMRAVLARVMPEPFGALSSGE